MQYSIIDIGSNTVKIAVLDEDRLFSAPPVFFKAVPLNLRSKVVDNRLTDSAIEELQTLLAEYKQIAKLHGDGPILAFATASLRGLDNTDEVLEALREKSEISVELISGETEAYFSFLGARGSVRAHAGITVDLGGGSTEILAFRKNRVVEAVSLPFGCITLYHRFFDGKYDYAACCRFVRRYLDQNAPPAPGNSIILSGGSAKAVVKYKNMMENKKCLTVGTRQFRRVEHHFRAGNPEQRMKIEQVLKDRFRLIPPAIAVFSQIVDFYGKEQAFVSRSGVREGCLADYLKKK